MAFRLLSLLAFLYRYIEMAFPKTLEALREICQIDICGLCILFLNLGKTYSSSKSLTDGIIFCCLLITAGV